MGSPRAPKSELKMNHVSVCVNCAENTGGLECRNLVGRSFSYSLLRALLRSFPQDSHFHSHFLASTLTLCKPDSSHRFGAHTHRRLRVYLIPTFHLTSLLQRIDRHRVALAEIRSNMISQGSSEEYPRKSPEVCPQGST